MASLDNAQPRIGEAVEILNEVRNYLALDLDASGGRGVELADRIDRLDRALDALYGTLTCPVCEAQITGR